MFGVDDEQGPAYARSVMSRRLVFIVCGESRADGTRTETWFRRYVSGRDDGDRVVGCRSRMERFYIVQYARCLRIKRGALG